MSLFAKRLQFGLFLLLGTGLLGVSTLQAQFYTVGGFESNLPSYWTKGAEPAGAILTWATDQAHSLARSLKITKATTSEAAVWVSENMVDYWSPQHLANVDIKIGAWVRTQNVNTNPANDDARWWIAYTFWDQAGQLIGETKLPINQSVASSNGWVADTNAVGETILPRDAWKTVISFVGGKNATGTVWADDFIHVGRQGAWAGQNWDQSVDMPTGWLYWFPPLGGNDGVITKGFENTQLTSEEAHSGLYSLKFDLPFNRQPNDGFVGTKRFSLSQIPGGAIPGDVLRISVWVKAKNLVPDSAKAYPVTWAVGFTYGFFKGNGNNDGFNNVDGYPIDTQFTFPAVTQFNWTKYSLDVTVPNDPTAKTFEVRLHPYARFTGTVYFDDLTVEKLDIPPLAAIGGFESNLPSYWTKGAEPAGATLTWATDQAHTLARSLKITKATTSEAAAWVSENMVDYWSPQHLANVDIKIGAWVRTQNVNTNPANDDARWWIAYTFWDQAGQLIGETKLPVNQSVASSNGWVADTNAVGETVLPRDAWKTVISFVGGKDATGTVWADDFIHVGRQGAWAGQNWDQSVDMPTGWLYWFPPLGGNDGVITKGFENTQLTSEEAHSGLYSLKFDLPFNRQPNDGFVGTKRYLLSGSASQSSAANDAPADITRLSDVKAGDVLRISVWVKAKNLVPDSAAAYPVTWAVGFTYGFFKGNGNNDGFNNVDGYPIDTQFTFPPVTQFDWTKYSLDVTVPNDPTAKALEVRLHPYARFTGTVYFDDLTVEKLDLPPLAAIGGFESNLPSYWTKGAEPAGATLTWATDQAHTLARSLKITKATTSEAAAWVSENMVDYWSPQHLANVDIKIGAWVRTQNVNTNPANDDARWWIAYTFWDQAGQLIGETKLPVNQSVASSNGWVADTNAVGETVLPRDAWKTVISFVGGKDATGTVWADDFIHVGRQGAWAGQNWDQSVDVPTGWLYWFPPLGGNDGVITKGFENTRLTTEETHSGLYSLKFDLPFNRQPNDGFVGTKRYLLSGSAGAANAAEGAVYDITSLKEVKAGDVLRISVWVKAKNLVPDSAAAYPVTWAVGFTYGFFKGNGNNDGFNNVTGYPIDTQFTFPPVAQFDWTEYTLDVVVPNDPEAKALEVRLHPYARFTGTVYFDDLNVKVVGTTAVKDRGKDTGIPTTFDLAQNYPNPFNPSTKIAFALPRASYVTVDIYNMAGQKIATLLDGYRSAGRFEMTWDGKDSRGNAVGSGLYFYRLHTGEISLTKRMLLMK